LSEFSSPEAGHFTWLWNSTSIYYINNYFQEIQIFQQKLLQILSNLKNNLNGNISGSLP